MGFSIDISPLWGLDRLKTFMECVKSISSNLGYNNKHSTYVKQGFTKSYLAQLVNIVIL